MKDVDSSSIWEGFLKHDQASFKCTTLYGFSVLIIALAFQIVRGINDGKILRKTVLKELSYLIDNNKTKIQKT